MKTFSKINENFFTLLLIILLSIIAAFRPEYLGDTLTYKQNFYSIFTEYEANYEPVFKYLSRSIYLIYPNSFFYFFCLAFIFNYYWFKSILLIRSHFGFNFYSFLILSLFLTICSSWYFSAVTNGLRQGLSLVFVYYGIIQILIIRNKIRAIIFILLSVLTHYSSFLIIPFIIFLFFDLRKLKAIFLLIALFYPLGLNEKIVEIISSVTGINIYESVKNYLENTNEQRWVGFQLNFYVYSIFWFILFYFIKINEKMYDILKIYCILLMVYFTFGFGAFSNRFGFIAWLFLPIIQSAFVYNFLMVYLKNRNLVYLVYLFLFFNGIISFLFLYDFFEDLM